MKRRNIFISNYSRIEQEIIDLSQYIDFSDGQLGVYSTAICDLLLRCGVEIESLYKEIYRRDIKKKLPKDVGLIVNELDRMYLLKGKQLVFDCLGFNFLDFSFIKPFAYKSKTDDDFYTIFCKIKHDRKQNFEKGTLRALLLAFGALYILNQIYLKKTIQLENTFYGEIIPNTLSEDTNVFKIPVYNGEWDVINNRFDSLKRVSGMSDAQLDLMKRRFLSKTNLKVNDYMSEECLYRVEVLPSYSRESETFMAMMKSDDIAKKTIITSLFGDEKDLDKLLDEVGIGVFDPILSMMSVLEKRHRLMVCINGLK
ncbi:hypothetical protein IJH15_00050 [Candidatus Saccharibacteria bacterium]|nr:hypothetical protein [Candidatus Saccharibacteria bacterium]